MAQGRLGRLLDWRSGAAYGGWADDHHVVAGRRGGRRVTSGVNGVLVWQLGGQLVSARGGVREGELGGDCSGHDVRSEDEMFCQRSA